MKTESITTNTEGMAVDLTWVDMLRGIAIIGVIFDNWTGYMKFTATSNPFYLLIKNFPWGPFVQVFFILSGFGLTVSYIKQRNMDWSWKRWIWRRTTKIVIPYVIGVIFAFALGILGSYLYSSVDQQFSWSSLFAHLTFTRNFFSTSWDWNRSFWFMPVIIGLYASFPVLLKILEKWGPWVLLLVAVFVTYGTLTIAVWVGALNGHQTDFFTFWLVQFSLGIVLAHTKDSAPQKLDSLIGPGAFLLGIGLFAFSWGLKAFVPMGKVYNDTFTSMGIFLILLNLCWASRLYAPVTERGLSALSGKSYYMYLIHYPIITFLIGPLFRTPSNSVVIVALGSIYIIIIFFLCRFLSRPIDKFTSWLYQLTIEQVK